ncbi:MAG: beta-propeller domain-containing protein, partial [Oligoflexia bacterium]|nr:beta-propeller domain-containing protein [Oligoflexia bacterium]
IFCANLASADELIKKQLTRYVGQTEFLNPFELYSQKHYMMGISGNASTDTNDSTGRNREIQESDVFKVGKENKKLLYLLNNYRGLEIISFEDGINKAKILGRTEATGNWSQNIYYHSNSERIITLENNNVRYNKNNVNEQSSKLIITSVFNPKLPKVIQEINMKGSIVDSRMVGDILYVVTRYNLILKLDQNENENQSKTQTINQGKIYSYSLKENNGKYSGKYSNEVKLIQEYTLETPLAYGELMNIVEVKDKNENKYHYYLLAVLQKDNNWQNPSQSMMVVDITSNEGKIRPLLMADLKGTINERSQALIKDDYLIAVSNYRTTDTATIDNTSRLRIAVQAFKINDDLNNNNNNSDVSNANIVRKNTADQELTVGSSDDLNASIQDVRFEKNLLYVFWVPQNYIDPLDVFDLSNIKEKITYKGRLNFDGWIQRSFPISYKGTDYIVGLGYITPSEDNEQNRRYPQIVLFKILSKENGLVEKEIVSSLTFSKNDNIWVDFNSADKMIELKFDSESGLGTILFQAFKLNDESYNVNGGKLIAFDLNNKNNNFKEGGFVQASSGWLKRVFHNPEINKVNTFTNEELATYDVTLDNEKIGEYNKIFKAINILELARNIINYQVIFGGSFKGIKKLGVQIVSNNKNKEDYTELRFVDITKADSERDSATQIIKLNGTYVNLLNLNNKKLFILTKKYIQEGNINVIRNYLSLITLKNDGTIAFNEQEIPLSLITNSDENSNSGNGIIKAIDN